MTVVPRHPQVSEMIRGVSAIAGRSRVEVSNMSPGRVRKREFLNEIPLRLKVDGSYHDLGRFISRLADAPRIYDIESVGLRVRQPVSDGIDATLDVVTFSDRRAP